MDDMPTDVDQLFSKKLITNISTLNECELSNRPLLKSFDAAESDDLIRLVEQSTHNVCDAI